MSNDKKEAIIVDVADLCKAAQEELFPELEDLPHPEWGHFMLRLGVGTKSNLHETFSEGNFTKWVDEMRRDGLSYKEVIEEIETFVRKELK